MFGRPIPISCRKYESRLEDYLEGVRDPELIRHLEECTCCREALENARLAGSWLRQAWEPAQEPRPAFLFGAMARIREQQLKGEPAFWSPLEFMASRLSLTAAILLLLLSGYLFSSTHRQVIVPLTSQPSFSAEDLPQPPADPVSNEEVLQSLAERSYGH